MFLDASAIIGIIAREADAASLAARLGRAATVYTSPIALYEAVLGLARIGNMPPAQALPIVERFLGEVNATVIAIDAALGRDGIAASDRFGRGRHPARLNMGDCFAYACAQRLNVSLLCKGDDFPQTDAVLA